LNQNYSRAELCWLLVIAAVCALLVLFGHFSLPTHELVAIVRASSGFALAALLIGGKRYWPGILLGIFLGNIMHGVALATAITIASASTIGVLASAYFLLQIRNFNINLSHPRDFIWLVILGAFGSFVSAVIGVIFLVSVLGPTKLVISHSLIQWWQADTLGIILVTPLVLVWRHFPKDWFKRERIVETIFCFGLAFLSGQIIFLDWADFPFDHFVKDYWMFPFVVWAAVCFGLRGTLLVISTTALLILLGRTQDTIWITENFAHGLRLNFWLYMSALLLVGIATALFLEKKQAAELALRQNRDLFNKLSQRVPGIIYQFKLFPDGRSCFPFASEGMLNVFGLSPEELQVDASSTFTKVHPEDYAGLMASIEESARALTLWQQVFRVVLPERGVRWMLAESQPEKLKDGSVLWHGHMHDVTERKLESMVAKERGQRLQAIFDTEPQCVKIIDLNGSLIDMNKAGLDMLQVSTLEEAKQYQLVDFILPKYQDDFRLLRKKVFSGEEGVLEFEISAKKGTRRWLEEHAVPMYDDLGEVTGLLAIVIDITERKQAEARILHLTLLYKALSEVNQAIVRMEEIDELFPLVCRNAVEFGGMKMAFVGQPDEVTGFIKPMASHGDLLNELDTLVVSSRADVPEGRGAIGTAFRGGQPVVINDFHASAITQPWHAKAAKSGINAIAVFPILRAGLPFAVFVVFHEVIDAFDEEAVALLTEMSTDVTFALDNFDRRAQQAATAESLRLAASVYETSGEGIIITDADDQIVAVNPAFTAISGYAAEDVLGKGGHIFRSGRHDEAFYDAMWQTVSTTGNWQGEVWEKRKNGEVYPKQLTISSVFNEQGELQQRVAMFVDVTQRREAEELIWRQANFDSLTSLPNRQMFYDRLDQDIKKASRAIKPLALMFLDLDQFKEINDTLGHDKGDLLLREVACRLAGCIRETDTVARLGGDEFTIILNELDGSSSADRVAQDILQKIATPFQLGDEIVYISASIGITFYPEDATTVESLLKNADQAMYAAKNQGRNRCHYFTASMQQMVQMRMQITTDLHSALAKNQFWVAYQPIVELATGAIFKAEALIRWEHPKKGLISPASFIPVAEETGLIIDIGDWVFKQAAQQVKHWRALLHPEFQISVNKSPVQFHTEKLTHAAWYDYLSSMDLPGQSIAVEITEGLLLDASNLVVEHLLEFRAAGMQVSLDDFGTGYSALSYLKKFEIDYIKIDQSFTRNLAEGSYDMVLCEAIIVMAHKLGMRVIAEGVETEEQKNLLIAAGCDFAQGYYYSRPVRPEELEAHLKMVQGKWAVA
jgi:diguanylate cyclase (GGDEF)-like protein/PAS domain S-box-containing protein